MSRRLASSFVVTVAVSALAGCGAERTSNPPPPEITHNPPMPVEEPTSVEVEPQPPEVPENTPETAPDPEVTETSNPPGPQPELPPAEPGARVTKRPDGTCWVYPKVNCPKGTPDHPPPTCNPPPPRQVACTEDQ